MPQQWGTLDPNPATFVPMQFEAGFSIDTDVTIAELEVHYTPDDEITIFLCSTAGQRDGAYGPWNNGSDVAHITLSADQRRALALILLNGLD